MEIKLYQRTPYIFDDGTDIQCTTFNSLEALDDFLNPRIQRMPYITQNAVDIISNLMTNKNEYIFGNWIITVITDDPCIAEGKPAWVGANYQKEAPFVHDDVCPDWGVVSTGDTVEEAALECIHLVWTHNDGHLHKAVELSAALVACGIIPPTCYIDEQTAIINGRWFFGRADGNKHGISPWNELLSYHDISEFKFSEEGKHIAEAIMNSAIEEDVEFNAGLDAWYASWEDGPMSW